MTVGIPNFLTPPLSLGISTLRTGDGLHLPFLMLSSSSSLVLSATEVLHLRSFRLLRLQFVVTTDFFPICKTSSGKRNHLHLVYLLYLRLEIRAVLDFVLNRKLVRFQVRLVYSFCSSDRGFARRDTFQSPHPTSFRFHLAMDTLVFG